MLMSIPIVSTLTIVPASAHTSNGVNNGANSVEAAVMPTDNARSPLAR